MKKIFNILTVVSLISCMLFSGCTNNNSPDSTLNLERQPDTQNLITIVENDPNFKSLLVKSIEKAKEINPDKETNPAQTLEEYYDFIDWATTAMPWNILNNNNDASKLYESIDQSLNYFYFINDMPLEELEGQEYYNNSIQYAEPYRSWMIEFIKNWGTFLSSTDSWNDDYYNLALQDKRFGLDKGWYEDPSNWKSFNDFFSRYLKSPDKRPIKEPNNPSVVTSPADAVPQGVWDIDNNSNIIGSDGVLIKSKTFYSISNLIGEDSMYKNSFAQGTLTHTFLDVNDYHRYHFPIDGTIKEIRTISADDAIGGAVTWNPELNKYVLNSKEPNWESIETRSCIILETEDYGLVALLPVGMSQVSSVNFEENLKVGDKVKKGDPLGYFLFGGSDFIIIFQDSVKFDLTVPKNNNGTGYEHILMGEEYGRISK